MKIPPLPLGLLRQSVTLSFLLAAPLLSRAATLTSPWASQDIGAPALAGSTDLAQGAFAITAGGRDIWNKSDQFHFAYVPLNGDGEVVARVASIAGAKLGAWVKAGVMIRETLSADSRHVSLFATSGNGLAFQRRLTTGGSSASSGGGAGVAPQWVKLVRAGSTISAFRSADGSQWTPVGSATVGLATSVYAGLALTSHDVGKLATATFTNVTAGGARTEEEIISAGLAAWRKTDPDGVRCVDCHSPMGYDIALFNFTREDVRRAGEPHLSQADNDAIFDMLEVWRAKYPPAGGLKDFRTFRPLQPGDGHVVGGADSPADVRDAAFGQLLKANFKIARDRVVTLEQARAAAQELIDVDLLGLSIGIKFNLWSRSALREGAEVGGEVAEWLPPIGIHPKPESEAQWFALQDAYIANPTEENLWAIFHATATMVQADSHNFTAGATKDGFFKLALEQYRGNLIFQHDQLQRARGESALFDRETGGTPFASQQGKSSANLAFFWSIGDTARTIDTTPMEQTPLRNQESVFVSDQVTLRDQMNDFRLTWMFMGWLFDNGLVHSGGSNSTTSGEYLIGQLWFGNKDDTPVKWGYPFHYVFFNATHQYKRGFNPANWGKAYSQAPQNFTINKNYYLGYGRWKKTFNVAGYPAAEADYKRLLSNHLRANLLIHLDEVERLGFVYSNRNRDKEVAVTEMTENADLYQEILAWADPEMAASDAQLVADYKATVTSLPLK